MFNISHTDSSYCNTMSISFDEITSINYFGTTEVMKLLYILKLMLLPF